MNENKIFLVKADEDDFERAESIVCRDYPRVELTPEVLKRIRKEVFEFMETNYIQSYREENIVKNTINEFQKALLKKMSSLTEIKGEKA